MIPNQFSGERYLDSPHMEGTEAGLQRGLNPRVTLRVSSSIPLPSSNAESKLVRLPRRSGKPFVPSGMRFDHAALLHGKRSGHGISPVSNAVGTERCGDRYLRFPQISRVSQLAKKVVIPGHHLSLQKVVGIWMMC